jgi:hypothetical protein
MYGPVAIVASARVCGRQSRQGRQRYKGKDPANPFAFGVTRYCH